MMTRDTPHVASFSDSSVPGNTISCLHRHSSCFHGTNRHQTSSSLLVYGLYIQQSITLALLPYHKHPIQYKPFMECHPFLHSCSMKHLAALALNTWAAAPGMAGSGLGASPPCSRGHQHLPAASGLRAAAGRCRQGYSVGSRQATTASCQHQEECPALVCARLVGSSLPLGPGGCLWWGVW